MRWQLSFILRTVQISHLTCSWLCISGQRATRALFFLSWLLSPAVLCVDFHFPVPPISSIFSIYSFISPRAIPVPSFPGRDLKPRVPELAGLWITDLCSSFFPHQTHLHKGSPCKSHLLCYPEQAICCRVRVNGRESTISDIYQWQFM